MNKMAIVITDGVGLRNFVLSNFIAEAKDRFDEIIIFSCLPKSVYKELNFKCEIIELEIFKEKFYSWFFRKIKEVTHLYLNKKQNFGIRHIYEINKSKSNNFRGYSTRLIYLLVKIFHSEKWIRFYNWFQQKTFQNNSITKNYQKLLKNNNISIVFFTHQRPPFIAPIIYAAEKLKIKTATFIFSWDNLSSKSRMAGKFDYYLVWSKLMKSELLSFYPEVTNAMVNIVGTPQFEPYVMPKYETKIDEFFRKFKFDTTKKIICYSCADVSIGKNDGIVIEAIANAIRSYKIIVDVQLLVRTSPAEDDARFREIRNSFPEIYWNVPKWKLTRENHAESWSQRVPSEEDIKDLRSLLTYVDLNINMCSTMSLDFMLFDKPVINTVFGNGNNGLYNDQKFLNYAHYKKVVESGAVVIAKNETELIEAINDALQHPSRISIQREKLIKLQISKPLEGTSKRIVETLMQLSK